MIHRLRCAVLVLMALVLSVPVASAKDMRGRLGVGVEQTLGGVSGAAVRYWMGPRLAAVGTLGVEVLQGDDDPSTDNSSIVTSGGFSVGAVYNLATSLHANLGLGLRVVAGFSLVSGADAGEEDPALQLGLEVPLVAEFFLSESFSISASTGLRAIMAPAGSQGMLLNPPGRAADAPDGDLQLGIGAGSVLGGLGVLYYF